MTKTSTSKKREQEVALRRKRQRRRAAFILIGVLAGVVSLVSVLVFSPFERNRNQTITNPDARLASFYAPEVLRWESDIHRWARQYDVNPNVIAIVMQIESCGHPWVLSGAGATGLMQVMPFHFDNGENMFNPDTNMQRGMSVFYECLVQFANWDLGTALACYNGGPSVTQRARSTWPRETQSYYRWATGMWNDVVLGNDSSETLDAWLAAGGQGLCDRAALVSHEIPDPQSG